MADSLALLLSRLSKEEQRYVSISLKHYRADSRLFASYRLFKKGAGREEVMRRLGIGAPDMAVLRSKLFTRVLDILADFSIARNIFLQFLQMRRRVEVLISKGLLREAEKQTEKLLRKAAYHEFFLLELEALRIKRLLMAQQNYAGYEKRQLTELMEEMEKQSRSFLELSKWQSTSSQLFMQFYNEGHLDETRPEYRAFLEYRRKEGASSSEKFVAHNTRGFLFGLRGEAVKSISEQKMAIEALMQLPAIDNERWYYLVSAFNNICIALCNEGDFHRAKEYLEKLRQLPGKRKGLSYRESIFWWQHVLALDFYLMMERAEFKNLDHLLDALRVALKQYDFSQWYRAYFHYSAAYALLLAGRNDDALYWVLLLLQYPQREIPEEIYRFGLLLQGLVHFESGNFEIAAVLLENHRRRLMKLKHPYHLESLFTRFLLRAARTGDNERKAAASACLAEIGEWLKEDDAERHVLDYLDIDIYLEAQVSGEPFYRFYQKKKRSNA